MSNPLQQTVHFNGIYHCLPSLPTSPEDQNLTALVTGATGISGAHMVSKTLLPLYRTRSHGTPLANAALCQQSQIRVLSRSSQTKWSKIYALSRRRPSAAADEWPETVKHVAVDFTQPPGEIAGVLEERGVRRPDYVFFFSYVLVTDESGALQWGDERLVRENGEFDPLVWSFTSYG